MKCWEFFSKGEGNAVNHPQGNTERTLGWVISSESCAFQCMGAEFLREVEPGELVEISSSGIRSLCVVQLPHPKSTALCIFEYVYFSRPDTFLEGLETSSKKHGCCNWLVFMFVHIADVQVNKYGRWGSAVGKSWQLRLLWRLTLCLLSLSLLLLLLWDLLSM